MLGKLPYRNKISPQSFILLPPAVTCHALYRASGTRHTGTVLKYSFIVVVVLYDRCAVQRARQEFPTVTMIALIRDAQFTLPCLAFHWGILNLYTRT